MQSILWLKFIHHALGRNLSLLLRDTLKFESTIVLSGCTDRLVGLTWLTELIFRILNNLV